MITTEHEKSYTRREPRFRHLGRGVFARVARNQETEVLTPTRWRSVFVPPRSAAIERQQPNLLQYHQAMAELVFEAIQEADGGYCAECLTENIFTQGDTWEELRANVIDATLAFFFDQPGPESVRLHLVRDEVLSVA